MVKVCRDSEAGVYDSDLEVFVVRELLGSLFGVKDE